MWRCTTRSTFARSCGLAASPVDPLIAFHMVFGKTVPDISLNAVANLGYAEGLFLKALYPGEDSSRPAMVIGGPLQGPCFSREGLQSLPRQDFRQCPDTLPRTPSSAP
eukprot:gene37127-50090_t